MRYFYFIILYFSASSLLFSQDKIEDLRFGPISAGFGTGDHLTIGAESQYNRAISPFFASSMSAALGKSMSTDLFENTSFWQLSSAFYVSPFKNNGPNDFRIGTGLSYYNISRSELRSASYLNGQLLDYQLDNEHENSFGIPIIIEDTFRIAPESRSKIAIKVYTNPYFNGDIQTGFAIKYGVNL